MPWVRLWDDMPTDPKWRVVARRSKRSLPEIIAVWTFMLVRAGQTDGVLDGWSDDDVAAALDMEPEHVEAIRTAMQGKVLDGQLLMAWDKRQPKREDNSAQRMREWRNREREKRSVTHGDAPVTQRDAPDTEADTDTEVHPSGVVTLSPTDPPDVTDRSHGQKQRRGSRLPDDWTPTDENRRTARSKGLGYQETEIEFGKFKAYYTQGPGRNKSWSDWDRALANWLDKVERPGARGADKPRKVDAMMEGIFNAVSGSRPGAGGDAGPPVVALPKPGLFPDPLAGADGGLRRVAAHVSAGGGGGGDQGVPAEAEISPDDF